MENFKEESFLRVKFDEQGKTLSNKIFELPKTYSDFTKILKENFNFVDEENFIYLISFKDREGDYLDISNSLDYDHALKYFENSKENYLKIKITKKDKSSKDTELNNDFHFFEYDSISKINMLNQSKSFYFDNNLNFHPDTKIVKSILINEDNLASNYDLPLKISEEQNIKRFLKKKENSKIGNSELDCNNNSFKSNHFNINEKIKEEFEEIYNLSEFNKIKINEINLNSDSKKLITGDIYKNEEKSSFVNNKEIIKNDHDINKNISNENLENKKDQIISNNDIHKNFIESYSQQLSLINENFNKIRESIQSQNFFENKEENKFNDNIIDKKEKEFMNTNCSNSQNDINNKLIENFEKNLSDNKISFLNYLKRRSENNIIENAIKINFNKSSNMKIFDAKDSFNDVKGTDSEKRKNIFDINKIKRNTIENINKHITEDEESQEKPPAYFSKKELINYNSLSNKMNKKIKKKEKHLEKFLNTNNKKINLKNFSNEDKKDLKLESLIFENTKKGFEKLLIKKISKIIDKELKLTQDIIFKKYKNLIKEFLKDFEKLIQKQEEANLEKKEKYTISNIHEYIRCNFCNEYPIIGIRFKCSLCPSLNICEKCERGIGNIHEHNFIKIRNPEQAPKIINTFIKENKNYSDKRIPNKNNKKNEIGYSNDKDEKSINFFGNNKIGDSYVLNNGFRKKIIEESQGTKNIFMEKVISYPENYLDTQKNHDNFNLKNDENLHINYIIKEYLQKDILPMCDKKENHKLISTLRENRFKNIYEENDYMKQKNNDFKKNKDYYYNQEFCKDKNYKLFNNDYIINNSDENFKRMNNHSKSTKLLNQNSKGFLEKSIYYKSNSFIGKLTSDLTQDSTKQYSNKRLNKFDNFKNLEEDTECLIYDFNINKQQFYKIFNENRELELPIKIKNISNLYFSNPLYLICNLKNSDIAGKTIPILTNLKPGNVLNLDIKLYLEDEFFSSNKIYRSEWEFKDYNLNNIGRKIKINIKFCFDENSNYMNNYNNIPQEVEITNSKNEYVNDIYLANEKENSNQKRKTSGILSLKEFKKLKMKKPYNNYND